MPKRVAVSYNYDIADRIAVLYGRTFRSIARSGATHVVVDLDDLPNAMIDRIEAMTPRTERNLMNLAWDIANGRK
jgi:hypothetical protein